ncbi:class I SAM-dependent methyltransferase [Micromonospora sp. BRA006-A]|nr:class I SAM-dependent methyltransferase [Micromonospora sp. BRA006-A]
MEPPLDRALLAAFAETVGPGRPVLEVGCGTGRVTAHLHWLGLDIGGADLSPGMVAVARRTYPDLRFEVGSLTELAVPDGSLAGLVSWYSVIHLPPELLPGVFAGSTGRSPRAVACSSRSRPVTGAYGWAGVRPRRRVRRALAAAGTTGRTTRDGRVHGLGDAGPRAGRHGAAVPGVPARRADHPVIITGADLNRRRSSPASCSTCATSGGGC